MPLEKAFSLTPRHSYFKSGPGHWAEVSIYGLRTYPKYDWEFRNSFDHQHGADEVFFDGFGRGDATADYTLWQNRRLTPRVRLQYDLSSFEPYKEVALTFRFATEADSRVLVYTDAEFVGEEILHAGDDQILIEVESTASLSLYFLHVNLDNFVYDNLEGFALEGSWYFRGIDGYIV